MSEVNFLTDYFIQLHQQVKTANGSDLKRIAESVKQTNQSHRKVICVGNGGSAAIASHVTVDFTKAAGIRAVNFNEADLLTCFANDYGYEHWVARALEFYADLGDLAILISSSGKSLNMINAAHQAKKMGLTVITLTGFSSDNPLRKLGDINLWVNSNLYNIVEMTHQVWLLAIVDYLIDQKQF